jgi:hypothetical protein
VIPVHLRGPLGKHSRILSPAPAMEKNSTVFRIRRIRKFLGLSDLDPLVRGTDPDPASDPPIIRQK